MERRGSVIQGCGFSSGVQITRFSPPFFLEDQDWRSPLSKSEKGEEIDWASGWKLVEEVKEEENG